MNKYVAVVYYKVHTYSKTQQVVIKAINLYKSRQDRSSYDTSMYLQAFQLRITAGIYYRFYNMYHSYKILLGENTINEQSVNLLLSLITCLKSLFVTIKCWDTKQFGKHVFKTAVNN